MSTPINQQVQLDRVKTDIFLLVGGFNPLEKHAYHFPKKGTNIKKSLKPPPSISSINSWKWKNGKILHFETRPLGGVSVFFAQLLSEAQLKNNGWCIFSFKRMIYTPAKLKYQSKNMGKPTIWRCISIFKMVSFHCHVGFQGGSRWGICHFGLHVQVPAPRSVGVASLSHGISQSHKIDFPP